MSSTKVIHSLVIFCESRFFPVFFVPLSVIFLLFYSISTSPLFAFEGCDSAIFQEIGLAVTKGEILYRDIFDNKGPLLYWLNALGLTIGGVTGILILQTIFQSVSFYFLFRIARLFTNGLNSLLVLLFTIVYYSVFILEGNQCEEWMLPMLTVAFYTVLKYYLTPNTIFPVSRALLLGLCFGLAFFIRPNDAVGIVGGLTAGLFLYLLVNRHYHEALRLIFFFVCGTAIVAIPIIVYFALHHALSEFYFGMFGVNIGYTGGFQAMFGAFLSDSGSWLLILLVGTACIMIHNTPLRQAIWVLLPCVLLEVILFGKTFFFHYYIPLLPIYAIIFATLFSVRHRSLIALASLVVVFTPISYSYRIVPKKAASLAYHQVQVLGNNYHYSYGDILNRSEHEMQYHMASLERLGSHIPTSERDSVWNYNLIEPIKCHNYFNYIFFAHNDIVQMNRITFPLINNIDKDPLSLPNPPLWVIVNGNNDIIQETTFSSKYSLIDTYQSWDGEIQLYKRTIP